MILKNDFPSNYTYSASFYCYYVHGGDSAIKKVVHYFVIVFAQNEGLVAIPVSRRKKHTCIHNGNQSIHRRDSQPDKWKGSRAIFQGNIRVLKKKKAEANM